MVPHVVIVGTKFSGTPEIALGLEARLGCRLTRTPFLGVVGVVLTEIHRAGQVAARITACASPLFDAQAVYARLVPSADALITMMSRARFATDVRRQDHAVLRGVYDSLERPLPVVAALNDFWCGQSSFEMLGADEVDETLLPDATLLVTRIGTCHDDVEVVIDAVHARLAHAPRHRAGTNDPDRR